MVLFQGEIEGCLVLHESDSDSLILLQTFPQLELSSSDPGQVMEGKESSLLDRYVCDSRSNTQHVRGPYRMQVLSALHILAHAVLAPWR